ncbi:hypothetical protein LEMLEM_LOCUS19700 [Lemmus lemmus]
MVTVKEGKQELRERSTQQCNSTTEVILKKRWVCLYSEDNARVTVNSKARCPVAKECADLDPGL